MEALVSLLVNLIGLIQTIVLSIALPLFGDTPSILTHELSRVVRAEHLNGLRFVPFTTVIVVRVDLEAFSARALGFQNFRIGF